MLYSGQQLFFFGLHTGYESCKFLLKGKNKIQHFGAWELTLTLKIGSQEMELLEMCVFSGTKTWADLIL